jgi:hypothetical protein
MMWCPVTKKERGSTISTQPIDCLQQTLNAQSDPDLSHIYKPPIFLTLRLSADPFIGTLQIMDIQHTATW